MPHRLLRNPRPRPASPDCAAGPLRSRAGSRGWRGAVGLAVLVGWGLGGLAAARMSAAAPSSAVVTLFSRGNGQFIVHGVPPSSNLSGGSRGPLTENTLLRLDPALVLVTCDRIKQALLRELDSPDQWRGAIRVNLRFIPVTNAPVAIRSLFTPQGWQGRVEMPDEIPAGKMVRALVHVLLLEMANRKPGAGLAEIPYWLTEGLTQRLWKSSGPLLVLQSDTRVVQLDVRPDPMQAVRARLRQRTPMTFEQLSLPDPSDLAGEAGENYQDSACLLVGELERLPGGQAALREMLQRLPRHLNWQTAFFKAFQPVFQRPLDVEKWWAVTWVNATGDEPWQPTPPAVTRQKLEDILSVPVQVRLSTNTLPSASTVPLRQLIDQWDFAVQRPLIQNRIDRLWTLRTHAAPDWIALVDQYRQVLELYLKRRAPPAAPGRTAPSPSLPIAFIVRETLQQLDRLDRQRADRPQD